MLGAPKPEGPSGGTREAFVSLAGFPAESYLPSDAASAEL